MSMKKQLMMLMMSLGEMESMDENNDYMVKLEEMK